MEHLSNVLQMRPDLLPATCIGGIGSDCFDRSAILGKPEMMNRLFVREAHDLIAALYYCLVVRVGRLLSINAIAQ